MSAMDYGDVVLGDLYRSSDALSEVIAALRDIRKELEGPPRKCLADAIASLEAGRDDIARAVAGLTR